MKYATPKTVEAGRALRADVREGPQYLSRRVAYSGHAADNLEAYENSIDEVSNILTRLIDRLILFEGQLTDETAERFSEIVQATLAEVGAFKAEAEA